MVTYLDHLDVRSLQIKKSRTIGQSDNQTIIIGIIGHCHCSIIIRLYHGPWFYSYSMGIGDWGLGIGDGLVYVDIGYVVFPSVNGVSPIPACWVVWLIVLLIGWHWKEWHGNGEWTVNWTSWTVELAIIGLIGPWKVCGNSSYSNSQLPTDQKSEKANIFLMPMPYAISHWDYAAWNWTAQQTRQRSLRDHFVTSLFQCALLHANYKAKKGITNCHESIPNPESYFLSTIDQNQRWFDDDHHLFTVDVWAWTNCCWSVYLESDFCEFSHFCRSCDPSCSRIAWPPWAHSEWRSWHSLAPALDLVALHNASMPVDDGCQCISG